MVDRECYLKHGMFSAHGGVICARIEKIQSLVEIQLLRLTVNENVELWPSLVVERLSKFVVQKNGGLQWKWLAKFEFQKTNESLECKALTNYEPKRLYENWWQEF